MQTTNTCLDCEHARKAGNKKYICCSFYSLHRDRIDEIPKGVTVFEGWGKLRQRPRDEGGDKTADSGLMTNYCLIVPPDAMGECMRFKKMEVIRIIVVDRIEKGKEKTAEAIRENDSVKLKAFLDRFLEIKAPPKEIAEAILNCPIDLLAETGYTLKVHSDLLGRDITLGKDLSWAVIKGLIEAQMTAEALKVALEAAEMFGGTVMEVRKQDEGVHFDLFSTQR